MTTGRINQVAIVQYACACACVCAYNFTNMTPTHTHTHPQQRDCWPFFKEEKRQQAFRFGDVQLFTPTTGETCKHAITYRRGQALDKLMVWIPSQMGEDEPVSTPVLALIYK